MLAYTIEAAAEIPEIDLCVVSTDDPEIASAASAYGARVILRPASLATTEARVEGAVLYTIDALEEEGASFDVLTLLEPTSPLRRASTVSRCIRRLIDSDGDSLLTVRPIHDNLGRLQNGLFHPLFPDAPRRQQERETLYVEAGVAYVCRIPWLRKTRSFAAADWLAEPVSEEESLDINEPLDLLVAETMINQTKAES
jgi:CMP-N-acetylneuraminic acid synthetase